MFKVENLTKVYSKNENEVKALNNINFTLDNKGFVFIVGKSGSGKSTLLNMLGGLDNITNGDIYCDNLAFSKFTPKDFDNYRNTYLGFIFQDYCLIEDLSVKENISLSLSLKGKKLSKSEKEKLIDETLDNVDIDKKIKNRLVKELSGGQKQRIAIARALIKSPKLILADEPTGNLDSKTSTKILSLLKKLSQDRLVVIVSHNLDDAKKYADRIIELSDGKIVSDITRNTKFNSEISLKNGVLTLPSTKNLTNRQLKEINENLKNNNIKKVRQKNNEFIKTKATQISPRNIFLEHQKMSLKNSIKFSSLFLRKRTLASIFTTLSISLLVFILGICQFFMQFNAPKTSFSALEQNNEKDLFVYSGYYDDNDNLQKNRYIEITDDQFQEFKDSGYTGNIFKIYRNPLCLTSFYSEEGFLHFGPETSDFLIKESQGTMVCTQEHLTNLFGKDGKLDYIGDLSLRDDGLIITDYFADCILQLKNQIDVGNISSYEDIIGKLINNRRYINAIIKTDYKEKYSDLYEYKKDIEMGIDRSSDKDYFKEKFQEFALDVNKHYGFAYSINENFEETIQTTTPVSHTVVNYGDIKVENTTISFDQFLTYTENTFPIYLIPIFRPKVFNLAVKTPTQTVKPIQLLYTLKDNEIAMEYDVFNHYFGQFFGNYTEENYHTFKPVKITLNKYDGTKENNLVFSEEITIALLLDNDKIHWSTESSKVFFASPNLVELFNKTSQYTYGLYFDDASQLDTIYNILNSNPYIVHSPVYNSIKSVGDIVDIFESLFAIILIVIGGVCLSLLITYAFGNIKKRYYEIGIMKALGATTKNVGLIFSLQTILTSLIISIVSTTALIFLTPAINNIIATKLMEFINNKKVTRLAILKVDPITLIINVSILTVVTIASCVLPLIKLNKIKPKNIIMNKD